MKRFSYLVLIVIAFASCTTSGDENKGEPVARVFGKYLYESDLTDIVENDLSASDSIALVKDFIDNWVFEQLMVHEAEERLSEEQMDVEKQIEDYRTSLLIFKLEQNHVKNSLDTVIARSVIEEYFNTYPSNFILNDAIVKAILIKLPKDAPSMWRVRNWFRSDKSEDLTKLEEYCFENKGSITSYDDFWYSFTDIQKLVPNLPYSTEWFLKNRKTAELSDSDYYYLLKIYNYYLSGSTAPIEYVENDIATIIQNKQKLELINNFEKEIYNNALNKGNFNIY